MGKCNDLREVIKINGFFRVVIVYHQSATTEHSMYHRKKIISYQIIKEVQKDRNNVKNRTLTGSPNLKYTAFKSNKLFTCSLSQRCVPKVPNENHPVLEKRRKRMTKNGRSDIFLRQANMSVSLAHIAIYFFHLFPLRPITALNTGRVSLSNTGLYTAPQTQTFEQFCSYSQRSGTVFVLHPQFPAITNNESSGTSVESFQEVFNVSYHSY